MRSLLSRTQISLTLSAALLLAACATSGTSVESASTASEFRNFLVIVIAGDYDSRAQLERMIVSEVRKKGADGSPYHSVVGGNNPVVKEDVLAAVHSQGFDALLAIRGRITEVDLEVKRSRTETDAAPIGGKIVDMFRSEYTDYTNPETFKLNTQATLAVELYDANSEELVWSIEHQTKSESNLGLIIDATATAIVKQLDRAQWIAN